MLEVLKDLLVGFLGALLVECAPKAALFLVRLAARAMPPQLRKQMLNDWTAEVLSTEGNAQRLINALWILIHVPSIRRSYGYPAVKIEFTSELLMRFALLGAVACQLVIFIIGSGLILYIAALLYLPGYVPAEDRLTLMGLMMDARRLMGSLWYTVPITLVLSLLIHFEKRRKGSRA